MSEVSVYKLNLGVADFTYNTLPGPSWRSSAWGGSDTPNANYPEFGEMENVERKEGVGASGQNVIDASVTTDYTVSWVTFCGVGPLANGQFDCRGGGSGKPLKCRWKQFFKSSALNEAGYSAPLILTHGGSGTGSGLFSTQVFVLLEMIQTAGSTFQWNLYHRTLSGGVLTTSQLNNALTGHADTSDNVEHEMVVTMVPSTITGAFNGNGSSPGSATVASDGSIDVTKDGVSVIGATGIRFVINNFATTNPEVYYGKTIWHGD